MADIEAQLGRIHDPNRLDGFPALSYFMGTDQDAAIFQRFDRLSARNLLYLQSNLNELQAKLDEFDKTDAEAGAQDAVRQLSAKAYSDLKLTARGYEEERERGSSALQQGASDSTIQRRENDIGVSALQRVELHREIKEAMRDYREALIQAREVMNFAAPSNRALETLRRYFWTPRDKSILIGCDANMLSDSHDLVTLVQSNDDRLSRMLRKMFGRCFRDRKRNPQPDLGIYYFSEARIQLASYLISIVFSGILLLGAMACLFILQNRGWQLRLGLVALFTSLFALVIGLLTNAKRSEIFTSTAAYAAVLVVFISVNTGPSVPPGISIAGG
ncbi:hypothetical protein N431DRAFT_545683 [Stipitochalara longipes BDJ]|nr:hypothetical protein N431DRAFT_545683 [Stipitochalara longipes BDJ]